MTRPVPTTLLLPARAALFHRDLGEQDPGAPATGDVSLTVSIEDCGPRQGRRFSFHAARHANETTAPGEQAVLLADERDGAAVVLDRSDVRSSARFLAGAIAQARPATVLHNPPHREAAVAYRRSVNLGTEVRAIRSDRKV